MSCCACHVEEVSDMRVWLMPGLHEVHKRVIDVILLLCQVSLQAFAVDEALSVVPFFFGNVRPPQLGSLSWILWPESGWKDEIGGVTDHF